jgi:phage terminase large subunit GpA-like protein
MHPTTQTAEVKTEEFVAGRGVVTKWERIRRQNHWLDALCYACAAGSFAGVRLLDEQHRPRPPAQPRPTRPAFTRPDGSPWIDTEGWRERQRRWWG